MEHLSEICKIIEHGVAGNTTGVVAYAELLAQKLLEEGKEPEARMIENRARGVVPPESEMISLQSSAPNDLARLAWVLGAAALLPPTNRQGMRISLPGAISHGARALREMSEPLETARDAVREELEDRLNDSQPAFHAYGLETVAKHLAMLLEAVGANDAQRVRQIADLYVLE